MLVSCQKLSFLTIHNCNKYKQSSFYCRMRKAYRINKKTVKLIDYDAVVGGPKAGYFKQGIVLPMEEAKTLANYPLVLEAAGILLRSKCLKEDLNGLVSRNFSNAEWCECKFDCGNVILHITDTIKVRLTDKYLKDQWVFLIEKENYVYPQHKKMAPFTMKLFMTAKHFKKFSKAMKIKFFE